MSILVLNSVHHHRNPYEKHLKELGETLVLLTSEKYKEGFQLGDYDYVETFDNYDFNGSVEKRALELYEKYQYHTILADYEFDILRAAQLRELLDIKHGQTVASASVYRNKILMKDTLRNHGIHLPIYKELRSPLDLVRFVQEHGFPVVIKPIEGAGSMETTILHNDDELEALLTKGLPPHLEVEAFVKGEMYHVDGFVYDGEIVFVCSSKYLDMPIHYNNVAFTGGYILRPDNPLAKRLNEETCKVVRALDTPRCTSFHAEWFHTAEDEIIFCEIASRTGGGRIRETIKHSFGIDLYQSSARANCNLPIKLPSGELQDGHIYGRVLMLSRDATFVQGPTEDPPVPVTAFEMTGQPGKHYDSPYNCVDSVAAYIVAGKTEEEVHEKLLTLSDWFEKAARWE